MSISYPPNHVSVDSIIAMNNLDMTCQSIIRYIDPNWKRYGYPHLTGDLRVVYNSSLCEGSAIHADDVQLFLARILRYTKTNPVQKQPISIPNNNPVNNSLVSAVGAASGVTNINQVQRQTLGQIVYDQPLTIVTAPPTTIAQSRGCGCGRRR